MAISDESWLVHKPRFQENVVGQVRSTRLPTGQIFGFYGAHGRNDKQVLPEQIPPDICTKLARIRVARQFAKMCFRLDRW